MAQANLAFADDLTRHAVYIERLKSGQVRKFAPFLREIDRRLREILTRGGLTAIEHARMEAMLREVDGVLAATLSKYTGALDDDLRALAAYEGEFVGGMLAEHGYRANVPTAGQLWTAASSQPLAAGKGKLLAGFIGEWSQAERERVAGAIRLGVAEGQTTAQIVQAVRGTKAAGYADGVLAISARKTEAVVRTAVAHVSASARHETYADNADILAGYMWSATLDQRTSDTCRALDGRIFQFGNGPLPPAHVNCRSSTTPVLKDEWKALTKGAKRSSMDGPVDAGTTYYDWLKRQPAAFQDEVIGPTRGKLLRDGGLSSKRFAELQLDRRWQPLTLEEMRRLEPKAFKRAGLGD
ncbi:phage head morphogenesis protein [Pseudoxanthomonas kalamensis DSM 18571]|uniref:phage minor head protein n=1 Tax=Pseudoxanthomonas kalamensis TaxID=289483 RepID=UPI001391AB62|nr:phage minor head protein [Pseudoxanthomonas kalamensis]KAF1711069.1 phage head morphogenesis protein [Pseudoxanthomonas kalamensis DSM 18571]